MLVVERSRNILIAVAAMASLSMLGGGRAFAQACPSPIVANNTSCTVTAGTIVSVTPAGATGLNASGLLGAIIANGITVRSRGRQHCHDDHRRAGPSGCFDRFNGSTLATTSTTAATSANHVGLRATGTGSNITATGSSVTLGPPNGTTTASNMIGATAEAGAMLDLTTTNITMLGGTAGLSNIGLRATGAGSQINYAGGTIATKSQASFGVQAINAGQVTLGAGTIITTTGTGSAVIAGSHALFATGSGA